MGIVLKPAELMVARDAVRRGGKTLVLANGAFDLFHVGHLRYLTAARTHGDALYVAVNSDASVRQSKGPLRPWIPETERLEIVAGLAVVDGAFLFDEITLDQVLERLRPDVHAKGTDYSPETVPEAATMRRLGGRTVVCGDPKEHSTTDLIAKIRSAT